MIKFGFLPDLHISDKDPIEDGWGNGPHYRIYQTWQDRLNDCLNDLHSNQIYLLIMSGDQHNLQLVENTQANVQTNFTSFVNLVKAHDWWSAGGRVLIVGGNHEGWLMGSGWVDPEVMYDWIAENVYEELMPDGTDEYPDGNFGLIRYESQGAIFVGWDETWADHYGLDTDTAYEYLKSWGSEGKPMIFFKHSWPPNDEASVVNLWTPDIFHDWNNDVWSKAPYVQMLLTGHDHRGLPFSYNYDMGCLYGRGSVRAENEDDDYTHTSHYIIELVPFAVKGQGVRKRPNIKITGFRQATSSPYKRYGVF